MDNQATLPPSAQRVQDALNAAGVDCRVVELAASTRTAAEAASAVGCEVAQIVKSLIFRGKQSNRPLLVLASGANRVDEKKLRALLGEKVSKPDAAFVREQTGFAIGGVPPVGHSQPLETLIDGDLMGHQRLWAAAGTPNALFAIAPHELERLTAGRVADLRVEMP